MTQENRQSNAEGQPQSEGPRRRRWLFYVLVCVAAGLGTLLAIQRLGPRSDDDHPWVGMELPDATLDPLVHVDRPLPTEQLEGNVTLVNFWGPWCGYCLQEFPDLLKMSQDHAEDSSFQLLSISTDGSWRPGGNDSFSEDVGQLQADSRNVLAHFGTDLPVYVDTDAELRNQLEAASPWSGYPTTLLVDRDRRIVAVWLGAQRDPTQMAQRVQQELERR